MKTSKIMKALLVFGMSMVTATAVIGFTACGDECPHVDENADGKCDICGEDLPHDDDGGNQGGGTLKVDVEKVELNQGELTLEIGEEATLTATVTPDNADNKTVNWSVAPAGIVKVENGKVTAEAAGTATVTATAGGKSATCTVTVNEPAPKPTVTKEEWEAALSESAFTNFTALSYMSAEEPEEPEETPTEEQNEEAAEEPKDELKADLENGRYYVKENGSGVYYSKEADDKYYKYEEGETEGQYVKEEITKEDYDGTLAELFPLAVILYKDCYENENVKYNEETESYIGTGLDLGDGNEHGYNIKFKFDNGKLVYAEIDYGESANMILEYSNYGTTTVTLPTIGGEEVKVDVEKVELNKGELTLEIGGEETLTATVTPDNADNKTVTWTSSDTSVATVDNSGKVTAVAAGTATITATADGKSATCEVTVNAPDPGNEKGIELTFSNVTRYGGANNDENVEMTVKYDISVQEALTMGADKQFDAAYINGNLNADTGWADEGTPGGTTHQAHLWLRGFKAQYDTEYVVTLKKGDTVVATGTFLIETPKSMSVSSESDNLKGTALTLEPEDVVMLEASVTGKFPEGAAYKWEITEGAEYIELESDADTAMITAKAYTGEDNLTAKVKVTYGVDGTTVTKTINVTVKGTGEDNGDDGVETLTVTNVRTDGAVYLMATMNKHLDFSYIKTSCQDDETHNTPTQNTGNNRWESPTSTVFIFAPNADFTPTVSGYVYLIEFYDADGNLIARAEVTCP